MKKIILSALCAILLAGAAAAGDISQGAVPGSINYQGRLERDNAPITGIIHIYFRIYNASTGGTLRWTSSELVVQAAQGIFSANISPDWATFANGETLYLEVQVEGEILTPREPLNSVAYAIVAKKLEDGASVSVTTLTAAYQVLLATAPDSKVGIGNNAPTHKLTINGVIKLNGPGSAICFDDNTCTNSDGVGTASSLLSNGDSTIASGGTGVGNMFFVTAGTERMRLNDSANGGRIGIGPAALAAPMGTLDLDGSLYVGNEGIYDRDDGEVNVRENLGVDGGRITGANLEHIALGEVDNVIGFVSGGAERMRVNSNGYVGVNNAAPAFPLDVTGDMHTNTGLLASAVSAGAYSGWPAAANEVRAANLTHLLLQQNNPYNVGVGTDTPREKMHVRGSVRADYGVIAATAAFSGDVRVNGDFIANGNNKQVYLTTTTIYGTLLVTGGIGSTAGFPAYLASTQTLSGRNTFSAQVTASSDVVAQARLGAAVMDFDFPGSRYLQVGDNKNEYSSQDTYAYLVGGDSANSRLSFYRGAVESGSIGSVNGVNVGLIVAGSTKTLTDATYHRIQNSVVWISTGYNSTPAVYVSSKDGNVGIGTAVADPNYKLTVDGNIHIVGSGNGIIFPGGSVMTTASLGSASSLANSGDALVAANTGGGGGSVILRSGSVDGLVVDSGGNIGVGTLNPVSKLNVRGGDLMVGTPFSGTYSSNGVEDLLVGGSIIFDGALVQRSASAAQFSGLVVSGDVYLSTGTGKKTGIATNSPFTTLDVNGNAQFGQGVTRSTFTTAGVLQLASALTVPNGGTGVTTLASNGLLYGNGTGNALVTAAGAQYQVMRAGAGGTPAFGAVNLDQAAAVTGTLPAANGGTGLGGAGGVNNRLLRTANGTSWTAAQADLTTDVTGTLPLGNGGTGGTDAATARTSLGLAIGSDVQGYSARLATLAGLAVTDGNFIVGNGATWVVENGATARTSLGLAIGSDVQGYSANLATFSGIAPQAFMQTFLGAGNVGTARTDLGLAIGSDVQGYSANLATFSGIAPQAFMQTFLGSANVGTARTNLGVAIGSNVQAYNANLTTYAGIAPSADIQSFLGAADNAAARSSLGLGGGMSGTINVRNAAGTGSCTISVTNGIVTGTTCP